MYPVDDSKTCSIYSNSFLNDLKKYTIVDTLNDTRTSSETTQAETPNQCVLSFEGSYQKTTKKVKCGDGGPDGLGDKSCKDEDDKSTNSAGELLDSDGKKINVFSAVNIRTDSIKSILDQQNFALKDCWLPAFVKNDDHILSKEILAGNVIGTKLFGIENCVSIDSPQFNNWEIRNNNDVVDASGVSLSSNWIINSNLSYLEVEYGVLFWYKRNPVGSGETKTYKLSEVPKYTRLIPVNDYPTSSGKIVLQKIDNIIKIDDKSVKFLNKEPTDFNSNPPTFSFGSDAVDLSAANLATNYNDLTFYAYSNKNFVGDSTNFVIPDGKIWISDGECYSYFLNGREKDDYRVHRPVKMPSKSYLSPALYHIYRAIYNCLSINRVRSTSATKTITTPAPAQVPGQPAPVSGPPQSSIGTVVYQEKLKKLCSVLATGPSIDRVTINSLYDSDIQTEINIYLNSPAKTSAETEIQELLSIISKIYLFLSRSTSKIENQTNSINYIRTPSDLCKKMLMKYGADLRIEKNYTKKIKFIPLLDNGPHAYFDINIKTLCDKDLTASTSAVPSYIYNKFEYNIGDVVIKNSLDIDSQNRLLSQSLRILSSNDTLPNKIDIPWDITIESKPERARVNLAQDMVLPFTPDNNGEMKIDYGLATIGDTDTFLWQLIDGPQCLKFSNYTANGALDRLKRNNISNDSDITFYIKKEGLYTVECQIIRSAVLKSSDIMRLYIGNCDTSVPARTTNYAYPIDPPTKRYNALVTNLRQFALNKLGLVWIVDSDVQTIAISEQQPVIGWATPARLINKKIGLNFVPTEARNSSFSMKFETLKTYVRINSISIENMRYGGKYAKCKSFYQDKTVRARDKVFGINVFAARYFRQDRFGDASSFYGRGYDYSSGSQTTVTVNQTYNFPIISTVLSPGIQSYGGFSYDVIQSIGVEIPYHPVFLKDSKILLSTKKLPNEYWGGKGKPNNPILANTPGVLPTLETRNDMGGDNTLIRCHLMDIPVTGTIELKKGYFHPNSGWFPSVSNTTDYPEIRNNLGSSAYSSLNPPNGVNITSVQRYKMYQYKSYCFRGNGIFDMRGCTIGTNTSYNTYASRILIKNTEDMTSFFYSDHNLNFGYRNINGISAKTQEYIDDLYIEEYLDIENEETFTCQEDINSIPTVAYGMVTSAGTVNIDTLTIQDIELKINFLNYPNPKNLIFALEIHNPSLPAEPNFDNIFINNKTSVNRDIIDYVNLLNKTNTSAAPNTRILYLYNQESLEKYSMNFSMLFSDNYSHSTVFHNMNEYDTILSKHNEILKSDGSISPTTSVFEQNDTDSVKLKKAIIHNDIAVNSATFAKFKNIPLKNTSFILRVYVLGNADKILSMDNIVNNSELSGLSKFYTERSSNTIANSICSWDLIVHTEKTKKFHNKNSRCHFDYSNNASSTFKGYNFIADFTDKEYLLPKVNINAPFNYIANINYYCKYINDDELSRPLTYQEIKFPFVFMSFTPFFTLAGAMVAVWEIQQAASLGGRGDPIVNMLYDLRFQRMQEELERNYFQPGYEGVAQGYADKALVMLSKDKIFWYKMEIPIYKYENSDILKLKKYRYMKLDGINAKKLSLFKFSLVDDIENLVGLSDIKYTFDSNVTRVGLTAKTGSKETGFQTLNFRDGDIVRLSGQKIPEENGLYCVQTGSWTSFPDNSNMAFLIKNKLWNSNSSSNILIAKIKDKKILKIKGDRAYNFFDINDSITLAANEELINPSDEESEQPPIKTISDKYLINITDSSYTILVIDSKLESLDSGFIKKNNSNVLLVYSDKETFNDDCQIGKWGLQKSSSELDTNKPPNTYHTITGEGNYGYGTPYVDPDLYSYIGHESNNLEQIYDMLNNHENNKFKFNDMYITDSNNVTTTISISSLNTRQNLLSAYPFAINSYDYTKDASSYILNIASGISEEDKINLNIRLIENNIFPDRQTYHFMDVKSDKFKNIAASGEISFENDYYKHIPVQKLSDDQKTLIKSRIDLISTTGIPSNQLMAKSVADIYNIPDLITYYNNSPTDPPACNDKTVLSSTLCKKKQAKNRLQYLYIQRNRLIKLIEDDTSTGSTTPIPATPMPSPTPQPPAQGIFFPRGVVTPGDVLPMTQIELDTNSWTVKYKNKNYYWFNIDSNQTCSLAEEGMPRILASTEYICSPIVENYQFPECNSVCGPTQTTDGIDFEINRSGAGLKYINKNIDAEKAKYPEITDWSGQNYFSSQITKTFFLSCANTLKDTLVTVKETYLYPKLVGQSGGLVKDVFNLDDSNKIYMRFRIIPRKLKTIDPIYQRYVYDYNGGLGKDLKPSPGGPIYNGFSAWRCVDFNPGANFGTVTSPPDFFKVQNEMIFRAFFGSVDGIEIKNSEIAETKEMWEWIPYEYFDGPYFE